MQYIWLFLIMVLCGNISPDLQAGLEGEQDPYTIDCTVGPSSRLAQEERALYNCNKEVKKLLRSRAIPAKDKQYEEARSLEECEGILNFFKALSQQGKK